MGAAVSAAVPGEGSRPPTQPSCIGARVLAAHGPRGLLGVGLGFQEGGVTGTRGATHVITPQTGMRDRTVGMSLSASGLCDRQ